LDRRPAPLFLQPGPRPLRDVDPPRALPPREHAGRVAHADPVVPRVLGRRRRPAGGGTRRGGCRRRRSRGRGSMIVVCSYALVAFAMAQAGAPPLARTCSIPIAEGARIEEVLSCDFSGDDVADVCIATRAPRIPGSRSPAR